ncbi:MAG: hypothetical protein WCJ51_05290 [Candidatus Moraniibacteriota bacterium]
MDYDFVILFEAFYGALAGFYHSPFVFGLKILLGIYCGVLFVDIVLLLILRDVAWHYRVGTKGENIPSVSVNKMRKRFDQIVARLESGNVSQYKVAIIEADALVAEMIGKLGYGGENLAQKLEQVGEMHMEGHKETLSDIHKLRNQIVQEADFEIDREAAENALHIYEDFLKYMQFLD